MSFFPDGKSIVGVLNVASNKLYQGMFDRSAFFLAGDASIVDVFKNVTCLFH